MNVNALNTVPCAINTITYIARPIPLRADLRRDAPALVCDDSYTQRLEKSITLEQRMEGSRVQQGCCVSGLRFILHRAQLGSRDRHPQARAIAFADDAFRFTHSLNSAPHTWLNC